MTATIRWLGIVLVSLMGVVLLTRPAQADELPEYSDEEFQELIDIAFNELPYLQPETGEIHITGDDDLDDRIWDIAFERGYELQPRATEGDLILNDGQLMQQEAAEAWDALQAAADAAGHEIAITSAHRSVAEQRELFNAKLYSTTDAAIDERLSRAAPPGASRHHTGYAFDIREVGDIFGDFGATASYDWLAADNYATAKRFGFVPSYPPAITDAGPDPEPWEWVYVGLDVIAGDRVFADVPLDHFAADSVEWMAENGHTNGCHELLYCPRRATTRGEIAAFFKRVLEPYLGDVGRQSFEDTQGHLFENAIGWLAAHGITLGCDPPEFTRYCPDHPVTRGQLSAMIKRAVGHLIKVPDMETDERFVDTADSVFKASAVWLAETGITVGCNPPTNDRFCPDESVTRAELAVFLKRIVDRL